MKLKKCPFCGGEARTNTLNDVVQCKKFAANIYDSSYSEEEAIKKWNRRVNEPLKRNRPLNEIEQDEIVRRIINVLAEKQCTAQEAEKILRSAQIGVIGSAIVQHLD